MIKIENVSFSLGNKKLVDQVSLQIRPGQIVAILGPNGAGKSSLMKLLTGERRMQQGCISINNKEMSDYKRDELARIRSVVNQQSEVSFPFSLRDVIAMGRFPHTSGKAIDDQIVEQVMQITEISSLADRIFNTLSGGEQQRGQMARAIAQIMTLNNESDTDISRYILLDEPIANMDLSHQHKTLGHLKRLCKQPSKQAEQPQGRTQVGVAIVLHDLNLASLYADYIVVINNSRVETQGRPAEVFTTELIQSIFHLQADIDSHPKYGCPMITPLIH